MDYRQNYDSEEYLKIYSQVLQLLNRFIVSATQKPPTA